MYRRLVNFRKRRSLRPLDPTALQTLHGRERLHALVHRERARADRTGRALALVTFTLPPRAASRRNLLRLAGMALSRARVTDDVGWFDRNTIAALLPETDSRGAWCYAERVLAGAERIGIRPQVEVLVYPEDLSGRQDERNDTTGHDVRPAPGATSGSPSGVIAPGEGLARIQMLPLRSLIIRPLPLPKRLLDITLASVILLLASPVLAGAFLAVKWSSPGPAIFRQRRAGLGGRPFDMYKLRTMYLDAEARKQELVHLNEQDGPAFKIANDPRITPIGRFLRKTSIDELPQLINVIKGEMSLVGPRPPTFDEVAKYEFWYRRRLDVTPGITCIWQVSGRSQVSFENWMRMDAQYIQNHGFWQDLMLLLATIPAVLLRKGAC